MKTIEDRTIKESIDGLRPISSAVKENSKLVVIDIRNEPNQG